MVKDLKATAAPFESNNISHRKNTNAKALSVGVTALALISAANLSNDIFDALLYE
jgi:hypothetical protein